MFSSFARLYLLAACGNPPHSDDQKLLQTLPALAKLSPAESLLKRTRLPSTASDSPV